MGSLKFFSQVDGAEFVLSLKFFSESMVRFLYLFFQDDPIRLPALFSKQQKFFEVERALCRLARVL